MFGDELISKLEDGEMLLAYNGNKDPKCYYKQRVTHGDEERTKNILSSHENVNSRLKLFSVLKERFRHHISKHVDCLYAVANITKLIIIHEETLYVV